MRERSASRPSGSNPNQLRRFLTFSETARRLSLSRYAIRQMVLAGQLPTVHVSKRRLVPSAAVEQMLDLHPADSQDAQISAGAGRL